MVMQKNGHKSKEIFMYDNKHLENVQEYKYLGIIFKCSGTFTEAIKELSKKALKVLFMIRRKFHSSTMNPVLHLKLYEACIKPILLYCSEAWAPFALKLDSLKKNDNPHILEEQFTKKKKKKIHLKFCKYLLGTHKYTSNTAALAELGQYPMAIFCVTHSICVTL